MKEVYKGDYQLGLNEDQIAAFDELEEFMNNNSQLLCIKGFAGTGKTFVITRFFNYYKRTKAGRRVKVCLTAPTNKAVGVLRQSTPKDAKDIFSFATIHKLLGVKSHIDDDGEETFKPAGDKEIGFYNTIVVDEVSMLADDLFFELLEAIDPKNKDNARFGGPSIIKVVFMGDPKQIPPVNKEDCEPFLNPIVYGIKTIQLSKIMRQKGDSMIVDASYSIRENITSKAHDFNLFAGKDDFLVINTALQENREALKLMIKVLYESEELKSDPYMCKIIAWRNVQVQMWNNLCRSFYHAIPIKSLPQLYIGDIIINNSPIFDGDQILLPANTEMKILSIKSDSKATCDHITEKLECYLVRVVYFDYDAEKDVELDIHILKDESAPRHKKLLEVLANAAKFAPPTKKKWFWKQFYASKQCFADISMGFAITAHKSQGSTYKKVFVDVSDIVRNEKIVERNRILYTAITRASEGCIVITNK